MGTHRQRPDEWLQAINSRQRNVVFPDTLQNETRFWHNFGSKLGRPERKSGLPTALFAALVGTVGVAVIVQAGRFMRKLTWLVVIRAGVPIRKKGTPVRCPHCGTEQRILWPRDLKFAIASK